MTHAFSQPKPPLTRVEPVTDLYYRVPVTDPYRWLEDDKSPATRAWIEAQRKFTQSALDAIPGRDALRRRLTELMRVESISSPREFGGRIFYMKRGAQQNRASIAMRRGEEAGEEILIDPASISADETVSVDLVAIARDGKLLAYEVRHGGQDETEVRFFDPDARRDTGDALARRTYLRVAITPDRSGVYFSDLDPKGSRVWYQTLGTPGARPEIVFGEGLPADHLCDPLLSEDGRWLVINVGIGSAGDRSLVYLFDLTHARRRIPIATAADASYFGVVSAGRLYLRSTKDAPKGRIFSIDPSRPQEHFWRLIVPEARFQLDNFELAGGRLVLTFLENAVTRIRVHDLDGGFLRELPLAGLGTASVSGRIDSDRITITYSSFSTPDSHYRLSLSDAEPKLWWRAPSPIDPKLIEVEQVWYRSKDSTRVPMFLVSRRDVSMDGQRPTILHGYGGFAVSITPFFWPAMAAWVERGGVLAVANLRGGAEFGEQWHRAGMRENKQNVFDDFLAAAEYLVQRKVTNPAKLAIVGGSNGGLLVGAAITQKPAQFRAAICAFPLLDMLRFHHFLIAQVWTPEYGSSDDATQFEWLRRYSPYQHVQDGVAYPAVMFVTGDSDTRVAPMHARKMCARMQAATSSSLPILLHYDTASGHSGGLPVTKQIEDETDELSFLLSQLGEAPANARK